MRQGFTLIELSIVLVIIGLIVGGVLVGQDLIRAAGVRATISQIEKYNTAVNTFRGKYGALPGDMNAATASQFGFAARGAYAGEGDGNGLLEGIWANAASSNGGYTEGGETLMFWVDLSQVGLIDGSFTTATSIMVGSSTAANLPLYFPSAKLGGGNYIYVWSGGTGGTPNGINYYGLSGVLSMTAGGTINGTVALRVDQAYAIDKKMDDGLPLTGGVTGIYIPSSAWWAGQPSNAPATAGSATTCYDNGDVAGATQQYSVEENGGAGANCAISFQFQ